MSEGYRDSYDALNRLVPRSEHGRAALYLQEVGLWPRTLSPESARARMSACLNPAKDEKLCLQEISALTHWTKRYDVLYHLCDFNGLSRPRLLEPEELIGSAIEHARDVVRKAEQTLENANRLLEIARARTATPMPTARFSLPPDLEDTDLSLSVALFGVEMGF